MKSHDRYKPGDYYIICDRTGMKIRRSEAKFEWNGSLVHKDWWEPRHPQELIQTRKERIAVPDPRPEPSEYFLGTNEVTSDSLERSADRVTYGDEPLTFDTDTLEF